MGLKQNYTILVAVILFLIFMPIGSEAAKEDFSAFSVQADISQSVDTGEAKKKTRHFDLGPVRKSSSREWTIIVYMDGDNNLEPFALADINEMELGASDSVEIIVLVDRAKGYDTSEGDWKDSRIYRIRKDKNPRKIGSEILARPGELNLGDMYVV
jgi:hypothetical protein